MPTEASSILDRVLVLEMVRVTEAAAIGAAQLIGRGDEKAADHAAVEAMRAALNELDIDGTVVIGEGERDEAPMLYIGEKVGQAQGTGPRIDIALDPLEGTTITAKAGPNALAVLAIAEEGGLLNAPDVYMDKLACGPGYPAGTIGFDKGVRGNVEAIAAANATPYALGAYAFTRDLATAHRLAEELEAGMVGLNHFGVSQPELPFGGFKASGLGSEMGPEGLLHYTEGKTVTIGVPA